MAARQRQQAIKCLVSLKTVHDEIKKLQPLDESRAIGGRGPSAPFAHQQSICDFGKPVTRHDNLMRVGHFSGGLRGLSSLVTEMPGDGQRCIKHER